jgi:type I restriction enzyme S subunit
VGWEIKKLKFLTKIISKGTTPSTIGKEITINGDVRFIKAENICNNAVITEPENYIDDTTNNQQFPA